MVEPKVKANKGTIKVGQYVWVKDAAIAGTDLFTKGHVLAIDEKCKATVETTNDVKTQELVLPLADCHPPHPSDDVPDHCQLMYLSQPTLLENTRARYMDDKIYTYVGNILVAVNPFRFIPFLYTTTVMEQCKGKKLWNAGCGPHVYAVGEQVRRAASTRAARSNAHARLPRASTSSGAESVCRGGGGAETAAVQWRQWWPSYGSAATAKAGPHLGVYQLADASRRARAPLVGASRSSPQQLGVCTLCARCAGVCDDEEATQEPVHCGVGRVGRR